MTTKSKSKKKIVLVIFCLRIGGAEQFVITLAKGLKDLGHDVHILLLHNTIELPVPESIPIHIFPYDFYRKIPRFMRKKLIAKAIDNFILKNIGTPNLVLSNLKSVDQFLAYSQLEHVYIVIHNTLSKLHSLSPRSLKQLKATYLNKPCVGVSHGVTVDLPILLEQSINITTIYNPIDVSRIQESANEFMPPYQNYLINVSIFKLAKRHDILIKAFANSNLSCPLVLVGDGSERESCEQLAKRLGIAHLVHFVGMTSNPYPYIKHAAAMVISSDFEGLNIAMLEALSLNVPVISTACPSGPPEVLPSHHLVPVGDFQALAQKMQQVIESPKDFVLPLAEQFYPQYAAEQYLRLIDN